MILLDTHALIWWVNGDLDRLSPAAQQAIAGAGADPLEPGLLVSAISCWEVAMLVSSGRLGLSISCERWLELLSSIPALRLVPLEPRVAVAATTLPEPFHPDPADRFLVAQARELAIPLVSADSKIRTYPHVQTLW